MLRNTDGAMLGNHVIRNILDELCFVTHKGINIRVFVHTYYRKR
jgi:hypothetical protein